MPPLLTLPQQPCPMRRAPCARSDPQAMPRCSLCAALSAAAAAAAAVASRWRMQRAAQRPRGGGTPAKRVQTPPMSAVRKYPRGASTRPRSLVHPSSPLSASSFPFPDFEEGDFYFYFSAVSHKDAPPSRRRDANEDETCACSVRPRIAGGNLTAGNGTLEACVRMRLREARTLQTARCERFGVEFVLDLGADKTALPLTLRPQRSSSGSRSA